MDLSRNMDPKMKKLIAMVLGGGILVIVIYAMFIAPLMIQNDINGRIDAAYGTIGISTEEELMKMQPNGNYILKNDIFLSANWTPVGTKTEPFCGYINGNGYTIYAAKPSDSGYFPGLIRYASDGCLLNKVSLDNCNAPEGAFIAKISGKDGKILLNECTLSGDELPYYHYASSGSQPEDSNFAAIQVGYGDIFTSSSRGGIFTPATVEVIDTNGNKIIFHGCRVATSMTNGEALSALSRDRF